ncbi:MAG: hypothetical protein AAF456_19310 [Planctomycetota bacterium]
MALTIWGVFILVRRRVAVTGSKIVTGWPAIIIGSLFVGIFPMFIVFGFALGIISIVLSISMEDMLRHSYLAELGILCAVVVTAIGIATRYGRSEEEIELEKRRALQRQPIRPIFDQGEDQNPYRAPRM